MGEISLVSETDTGKLFALKHYFPTAYGCAEDCDEYWTREQEILQIQSQSPVHALQFQDAFKTTSVNGETEYYLLMEYIQGITLEKWIQRQPDIPDEATILERLEKIILPLSHHLEYVHSQGIIHRDITPRNIMILSEENALIPVLIDWGVAKLQTANHIARPVSETAATTISSVGNPPEVLAGFDPVIASDIYMLGNVMYYIFSGGKNIRPLREAEYVLDLEKVNPNASKELVQIIQKMTQFASEDRLQPL
jgi:serine/threonine-protein kinase